MKGWPLRKGAKDSLKVAATVWSQPHLGTIDETELTIRQTTEQSVLKTSFSDIVSHKVAGPAESY